jgi:YjbR
VAGPLSRYEVAAAQSTRAGHGARNFAPGWPAARRRLPVRAALPGPESHGQCVSGPQTPPACSSRRCRVGYKWERALLGQGATSRVSAAVEVPEDIVERIRTLCLALPEVTVRVDRSLTRARSTAQSFDIRRRSFCLLVALENSTGKPVPLLVLRADADEREALLSIGHPFFASRAGRGRIVVVLTGDTDWEEIRELVTESYRILAPKKLTALLD